MTRSILAGLTCGLLLAACGAEPDGVGGGIKPGGPSATSAESQELVNSCRSQGTCLISAATKSASLGPGGNGGDIGGSLMPAKGADVAQKDDGNYGGPSVSASTRAAAK